MVLDIPHLRVVPTIRGKVDADSYGLAPNNVARIMADDRAKNLVPFCLMPTLGTTSTSATGPTEGWQPYTLNISTGRNGAEGCDFICINTHKWLLVSFDASEGPSSPLASATWPPLSSLMLWFTFRRFGATGGSALTSAALWSSPSC
ncbi:unnamed protein product [Peronospora destructor]|nr:unnamed protein product [Peronospora destructor]